MYFCRMKFIVLLLVVLTTGLLKTQAQQTIEKKAEKSEKIQVGPAFIDEYVKAYYAQIMGLSVSSIQNVQLYEQIAKWLGTPYRYAGKTMNGIDCSSLVNKLFNSGFDFNSQGNSVALYKQCKPINKVELAEGDLVFFKTRSHAISHVGMYLGENKFVHSSRSNGVIISDLNSPYYKRTFYKAGRLIQ